MTFTSSISQAFENGFSCNFVRSTLNNFTNRFINFFSCFLSLRNSIIYSWFSFSRCSRSHCFQLHLHSAHDEKALMYKLCNKTLYLGAVQSFRHTWNSKASSPVSVRCDSVLTSSRDMLRIMAFVMTLKARIPCSPNLTDAHRTTCKTMRLLWI